ncbi:MAG: hypothetical protein WA057_01855 [Candidatus Magasanikiibacteriota bacterium]
MLTIITKPVSRVYSILKFLQNIVFSIQGRSVLKVKYGGHYAVTRSLVEGLSKIGAEFNYNPTKKSNITEVVVVLSSTQALKQVIKLKKKGLVKKIITGPNILMVPSRKDKILKSKEIDLILQPSVWPRQIFAEIFPDSSSKLRAWPAGVDFDDWKIDKQKNIEKNILIYFKCSVKVMFEECIKILEKFGYRVEVIYYGKYNIDQYKVALARNNFLIHLVEHESQGISLAEAWATNTPTLVWNPGLYFCDNGNNYYCSSAPYLSKQTGIFFRDIEEFENIVSNSLVNKNFSPRKWVEENMTDEICAKRLLEIIDF